MKFRPFCRVGFETNFWVLFQPQGALLICLFHWFSLLTLYLIYSWSYLSSWSYQSSLHSLFSIMSLGLNFFTFCLFQKVCSLGKNFRALCSFVSPLPVNKAPASRFQNGNGNHVSLLSECHPCFTSRVLGRVIASGLHASYLMVWGLHPWVSSSKGTCGFILSTFHVWGEASTLWVEAGWRKGAYDLSAILS